MKHKAGLILISSFLIPRMVKQASILYKSLITSQTEEYCKTSTIEDCKLSKEYANYLSMLLGAATEVGTAIILTKSLDTQEHYIVKAFETLNLSVVLGALGQNEASFD